jgi:hypothetical protein
MPLRLAYTRRFGVSPAPCGTYARNWTMIPRFRHLGRYVVTLRAVDKSGQLSLLTSRGIGSSGLDAGVAAVRFAGIPRIRNTGDTAHPTAGKVTQFSGSPIEELQQRSGRGASDLTTGWARFDASWRLGNRERQQNIR